MQLTRWLIHKVVGEDGAQTNEEIVKRLHERGITEATPDAVRQLTRKMVRDGQLVDAGEVETRARPARRFGLF